MSQMWKYLLTGLGIEVGCVLVYRIGATKIGEDVLLAVAYLAVTWFFGGIAYEIWNSDYNDFS